MMAHTWTTRDGRRLRLTEMGTDHLRNTAAFLRRRGYCATSEFDASWCSALACNGDMASYYAEQYCADLRPLALLDEIDAEIARRA